MTDLEFAAEFARRMHAGQTDKAGQPYVLHPQAVAEGVDGQTEKIAAWLHDTLEDTPVTLPVIRRLFGSETADLVETLTHREDETYEEYIRRIALCPKAIPVKMSDLRHNMDLGRLPEVTEKDLKRIEKYQKAYRYLEEHLHD